MPISATHTHTQAPSPHRRIPGVGWGCVYVCVNNASGRGKYHNMHSVLNHEIILGCSEAYCFPIGIQYINLLDNGATYRFYCILRPEMNGHHFASSKFHFTNDKFPLGMKTVVLWFMYHWSVFPGVQLSHWGRETHKFFTKLGHHCFR